MTKREQAVKAVIDVLKQGDFTKTEVALKAKISYQRKADRILEFLHNVGLVEEKDGKWVWSERKTSFSSRHEYDIAMRHSRLLVLSHSNGSEDYQGLDQMDPWHAVRLIAFNHDRPNETSDGYDPAPLLVEHLKSGYAKEFWLPMLDYVELQKKHHFPMHGIGAVIHLEDLREDLPMEALFHKSGGIFGGVPRGFSPDLGARIHQKGGKAVYKNDVGPEELAKEFFGVPPPYPSPAPAIIRERDRRVISAKEKEYYERHNRKVRELAKELSALPREDIDRAGELIDYLMGQLSGIVMRVRQGIPLAGSCSACPTLSVRIPG
jgi:hypothetical protein